MVRKIKIGNIVIGRGIFCLIAGPCVIEDKNVLFKSAEFLKRICADEGIPLIFKSSFDKANRTSISSYRGPGIEKGLEMLLEIKERFDLPVITDIHCINQVKAVSETVDIIQIPAFLCRQTDLLVKSGKTGKPLNIKKGQFLSPWDVKNIIEKVTSTGNKNICITERGTSFGYNTLITDFRALPIMRSFGYPVFYDATHSVQEPGKLGGCSGGNREYVPFLAKAAVAVGCDGLFMEVHPEPDKALSDGPNMLKLSKLKELLKTLKEIYYGSQK
ncbi:MAG TPA: 3-deoxy-8-phosphooctulonate synthase [bacterium]|nr:3-deoxy-8-phosphooctulonate synthase [bacterium]